MLGQGLLEKTIHNLTWVTTPGFVQWKTWGCKTRLITEDEASFRCFSYQKGHRFGHPIIKQNKNVEFYPILSCIAPIRKKFIGSSHHGSMEMNPTGIHEDASLTHGLIQWVKDPALPWAVVWVTDSAWIPSCCGCGVSQQCNSDLTSGLGTSIWRECGPKKQKIKMKINIFKNLKKGEERKGFIKIFQCLEFLLWHSGLRIPLQEFPSWLNGNESNWYPWGCRFDPWPCSIG